MGDLFTIALSVKEMTNADNGVPKAPSILIKQEKSSVVHRDRW